MRERPILFSAPMVRAILDGRKTQTRRVVTSLAGIGPVSEFGASDTRGYDFAMRDREMRWHDLRLSSLLERCPYGVPGDRLWVRETWALGNPLSDGTPSSSVVYRADGRWGAWGGDGEGGRLFNPHGWVVGHAPATQSRDAIGMWRSLGSFGDRWRPSIHMPRWASRLALEITEVRVERLQEITEEDARAEGVSGFGEITDDLTGEINRDAVEAFEALWNSINGADAWDANPWVWVVGFRVVETLAQKEAAGG